MLLGLLLPPGCSLPAARLTADLNITLPTVGMRSTRLLVLNPALQHLTDVVDARRPWG